ncbi:MAG: 4-hydroxy-tetrahydrodipicolinate synthase [Gammaproteobacteria bacterium]|nr:4-hydroxy-tetrahydrodipicolinate synthase [Gammaproteobacteria bacterium]MCW8909345.1 4-hydroxy-tetrahydrodipicolinate synthase [Gammaproteobacteria bacterium]MCW9003818.1 4-hydroxy-tetrahydrodipicolinate synthase [Gammaproteobacteria bacterium]
MFRGSMVALVTPMHADGSVDFESLSRLVEFHIENGTSAIISMGTTGESATLDEKEHCEVIRRTVEMVNQRIAVIAGTGANSTTEAINLTRCAMQAGADACLLVTPYYNKPTQEGLYLHHKKIAEEVPVPQILYNVPGRTACDMLPETVARLAKVSNIIGIKEATGDLQRLKEIQALCGDNFDLYSGDDATGTEFMLQGGHGVISVTTNVAPKAMAAMCEAALAGDREKAMQLNAPLEGLHEKLFVEANPIPVKWALQEMAMIPEGIRLPLTPLSEKFYGDVRAALLKAGIN